MRTADIWSDRRTKGQIVGQQANSPKPTDEQLDRQTTSRSPVSRYSLHGRQSVSLSISLSMSVTIHVVVSMSVVNQLDVSHSFVSQSIVSQSVSPQLVNRSLVS